MQDVGSGNCVSCHALPGLTGLTSTFAPSLAGIGARMGTSELRQWVFDARRIRPDTLMPPFGTLEGLNRTNPSRPILNERQIQQVVAALQTLR
jgi:L-cysteine S-thiosulfotransferase